MNNAKKYSEALLRTFFFCPCGITSLATHTISTYYWFFWYIYLKPKISSYLIQLHGLGSHGSQDPNFKSLIHGSHFIFINWDHNLMKSSTSTYGLGLSNESKFMTHITSLTLMASGFFNKSSYLHKMTTKPKVCHFIFDLWSKLISLFGKTLRVVVWGGKMYVQ